MREREGDDDGSASCSPDLSVVAVPLWRSSERIDGGNEARAGQGRRRGKKTTVGTRSTGREEKKEDKATQCGKRPRDEQRPLCERKEKERERREREREKKIEKSQ